MVDVLSQALSVNDNCLCLQIICVNHRSSSIGVRTAWTGPNKRSSQRTDGTRITALRISYSYLFNPDGSLPVSVRRMDFGFLQPTDPTCLIQQLPV